MSHVRKLAVLCSAAIVTLSGSAWAAAPAAATSAPATTTSPKRALPDGFRPAAPYPGQGALLLPRILLLPPYLVWNYGIRAPLGLLTTTAERNQWPTKILEFFTFGPDRNAGVVPTALFDFGIKPSVGLFAFWNQALHPDNAATFHVGTWGPRWLNFTASDRLRIGPESFLTINARYTYRPDTPFYGLGARTLIQERVRYRDQVGEVALGADLTPTSTHEKARINQGADAPPARVLHIITRVGVRTRSFGEGRGDGDFDDAEDFERIRENDDMGMVQAIREGRVQEPPGFARGYTNLFQRVHMTLDTRPRRPANQSGFKLSLEGEHGADVAHRSGAAWMRYGGTIGAFLDVGRNRTFGLHATAMFADPLRGEVPFTEQVVFGGAQHMRGFLWNRLIGRSGAVATLEYSWPIWVFLDGTLQTELGNVFDAHLADMAPRLLRMSTALGVRSSNLSNQSFEAMLGIGTETFADGFHPNSVRIVIGTSQF